MRQATLIYLLVYKKIISLEFKKKTFEVLLNFNIFSFYNFLTLSTFPYKISRYFGCHGILLLCNCV